MRRESIAIVGLSCRFPGNVRSPEDLRELLRAKRSGICDIPADRWDRDAFFHPDFQRPGFIHVKRGGFLERVAEFDAAFFGISPNEAKRMDPQQRMILELAFEAIEDAGIPLERLASRSIAVTLGAGLSDYGGLTALPSDRQNISGTTNTGSAFSILANRISYLFDLRGPSFSVDTACSSSFTALDLACRAIWDGRVEAALTGGANFILKPEVTLGFSKGGYLSPDAECRSFSDDANGYVRSEGAAIALLKPVSRALADGDRIYALIRNTWLNQDGRTSGMTAPSPSAQEDLLRSAFEGSGIDPAEACYIEAHGTGTPAGDPVEAIAIGNVVGRAKGRRAPCYLGSVKSNLGHMEFAAGMGGLIKLALVLQKREVLPNIHFRRPNPKLDLEHLGLRVATEAVALAAEGPLYGGVNSFGFGGANGHVVLESPPARPPRLAVVAAQLERKEPVVLALSARSPTALQALAGKLGDQLRQQASRRIDEDDLRDLAATLFGRRSRFEFRLACVGSDPSELAASLADYAETGKAPDGLRTGRVIEGRREKLAFVFTGQGAQWFAMARSLLAANPTFAATLGRVEAELHELGWLAGEGSSLRAELGRDEESSRIGETQIAQPCLFGVQVALVAVLAERGIQPTAVIGHSIGELAAAVASGALTLQEATRIVYWRSRCQALAEGKGAMAALGVSEEEALRLVQGAAGQVEIAAVNGPSAVTIAGTHDAVEAIVAGLEEREIFCRRLDISVPFHCHLMDPIEADFRAGLGTVRASASRIDFFSTVDGRLRHEPLDVDYWYANIRQPVRFAPALRAMADAGISAFVEVGPHPALMHGALDTLRERGSRAVYVPTLRRLGDDAKELATTIASLFVAGASPEPGYGTVRVPFVALPRYPFERRHFWIETDAGAEARKKPVSQLHPHLGPIEKSIHAANVFSCRLLLNPKVHPYLLEHRAQGHIVLPAAGQCELVTAAARHVLGTNDVVVENLDLRRPMVLTADDDADAAFFRLEVYADDGHFVIASRVAGDTDTWMEHTRGSIRRRRPVAAPSFDLQELRQRIDIEVSATGRYRAFQRAGLELGPAFRSIVRGHRNGSRTEWLAEIVEPSVLASDRDRYVIHPAVLDAFVQSGMPIESDRGDSQQLFLPHQVKEIRVFGPCPKGPLWSYVRLRGGTRDEVCVDVDAMDGDGQVFLRVTGLVASRVNSSVTARFGAGLVYDQSWLPAPVVAEGPAASASSSGAGDSPPRESMTAGAWLVLTSAPAGKVSHVFEQALRAAGRRTVLVTMGTSFARIDNDVFAVRPGVADDMRSLVSAVAESVAGVVHLWNCEPPAPGAEASDVIAGGMRRGPLSAGQLVTALGETGAWTRRAREMWLVTRSGSVVRESDRDLDPGAATLWGFGRVLMSEQRRLATTLLDLGPEDMDAQLEGLARELARGPVDAEVAYRGEQRFVRSLTRSEELRLPRRLFDASTEILQAKVRVPGALDSLTLEQVRSRALLPHEVEVSVRAAGLNFRDVVQSMNMLPKEALERGHIGPNQFGSDVAGTVLRAGSAVSHVAVGDRVFGFMQDCVATRVIGSADHLRKIAPEVSFELAAALPLTFMTAHVALNDLARLKPGEIILVHAAAGGVGSIAVQIARGIGARVFATTSSEEKREFLRGMGVEQIFNSRSADFSDDVLEKTGGRGVDVVLNSLSGAALTESLRSLRAFGRFVEIGKTDLYRNRQIGLSYLADNKSYFCLDINRYGDVKQTDEAFGHAMTAAAAGALSALPIRLFPLSEAVLALRCLAQGKQIGKVVVQVPEGGALEAESCPAVAFDPEAVYLVTGGCAGFGLALAEWLCTKGARHLALAGRRGLPGEAEKAKVAALEQGGAQVRVHHADIGVQGDVGRLLTQLRATGRRLGGVFHAAAVLDDAPIGALDEARYARALDAKARGAYHLHEGTRGQPLDYFVLFSSIAAIVGTPGQANYAAANAVLDELAAHRVNLGLPGTSVNWGVIDDVGMVARAAPEQRQKILGQGVGGLPSDRAFEVLERILLTGATRRVVADLDLKRFAQTTGAQRRFAALVGQDAVGAGDVVSLGAQILQTAAPEQLDLITSALSSLVSQVAGLEGQRVDVDTSIGRYGFDSLMIAQLQTWIEEQLGITMPMVHLMRGPSTSDLAQDLLKLLRDRSARSGRRGEEEGSLLRLLGESVDARFALVCFPPLGVEGDAFAGLKSELPDDVALYALDLPTTASANADLLLRSTDEQHAMLADAIEELDIPFAFYGHSMGAYIALDVSRYLRAQNRARPAFVTLGAVPIVEWVSGLVPDGLVAPEDITDAMVESAIARMSGGAPAAVTGPVMERVRRDLWLTFRGRSEGRLRPDVTAEDRAVLVGGKDDPLETLDKITGNALEQLGHRDVVVVAGSHLFLLEPEGQAPLSRLLARRVASAMDESGSASTPS